MNANLPEAVAVRRPGRTDIDPPYWVVRVCPFCRRRHVHRADLVLREMALPAKCGRGRAYRVVEEVAEGGRPGA